ncbi:hypothetical protein A6E15_08410 [Natrinema saccharevitans]|uniref:DUF8159 domain-containing protein n=1 Tax=Natrinema saccharevitans TaxID=301967 RepID=A0A1S8AWT3_9EURY|nr:hypothetical protein [Natrinema saccharevitans]OLZ41011.1 hypothetical protein A6E15_08410 [Natrinema saccharevitans]
MSDNESESDGGAETAAHPVSVTLENRLMSHGYYVTSFDWRDGDGEETAPVDGVGIDLEYEAVSDVPAVTRDEVGAVLRTLLSIGEERSWTPGRLEVTSVRTDGTVRGRWHVEREWFDRLGADLSQVEFSQLVLETVRDRPSGRNTD